MKALRKFPRVLLATLALPCLLAGTALAQHGTWSQLDPEASAPDARREFGAVYDVENHRYVIFGGFTTLGGYTLLNEVWTLSLAGTPTWSHLTVDPGPGERHSPQWGYDAARNRVLIFGGYGRHTPGDPYAYLNDVWELSLDGTPHWTELTPAGTPPSGRLAGAAVFDPLRQRFVGFGGTIGTPVDTWVLKLQGQPVWQSLPTLDQSPNGSYGMTSVYDASRDRMLIFGGSTGAGYYGVHNDVWELELHDVPRWNKLEPTGPLPQARRSGTAIFDPLRGRMVVYGGWDNFGESQASFLGDAWALSFDGESPSWTPLAPAGTAPLGRDAAIAAYDPIEDRLVVFGGWNGSSVLEDTQFLGWGGSSAAASLAPEASVASGVAHVEWQVTGATGPYAGVYRREPGGEWTSLATAEIGAGGVLSHDDTPGAAGYYEYMAVVGSQRGETFGGEVGVQVPTVGVEPHGAVAFALDRVAPSPVVGRLTVSLALPSAEPARLVLVDLAGRRAIEREVGSLGTGAHRVTLEEAERLPAGMYFLKLEQAGRAATTRVVIAGR